ncbi:MAG: intradiol ring-cleavage dioxygenase [Azospirillaceae bacterium]
MQYFTEANSVEAVLARMTDCPDPRLRQVMESVVRHLHAVVKEVEPTMEEWFQAIGFLTATGQICDDKRQEWILLSDTLGVSMLVDAINNRKHQGGTESTVIGPFHVAGAPRVGMGESIARDDKGEPAFIEGRVLDVDGKPVEGAELDVWQASDDGFYDIQQPGVQPEMNLRGRFTTGADGRFWFWTVKPSPYPIPTDGPVGRMLDSLGRHPYRPAHIHFIVSAPGFDAVTTHLFVEGGAYLDSDAVFGVKDSLVVPFRQVTDAGEIDRAGAAGPFWRTEFDFTLEKSAASKAA